MLDLTYQANDIKGTQYLPSIGSDTQFKHSILSKHIQILLVKLIYYKFLKAEIRIFFLVR